MFFGFTSMVVGVAMVESLLIAAKLKVAVVRWYQSRPSPKLLLYWRCAKIASLG